MALSNILLHYWMRMNEIVYLNKMALPSNGTMLLEFFLWLFDFQIFVASTIVLSYYSIIFLLRISEKCSFPKQTYVQDLKSSIKRDILWVNKQTLRKVTQTSWNKFEPASKVQETFSIYCNGAYISLVSFFNCIFFLYLKHIYNRVAFLNLRVVITYTGGR